MLGIGAVMGFSPREVGDMSLWEFTACTEGWVAAHSPEEQKASSLSEEEHDALMAKY